MKEGLSDRRVYIRIRSTRILTCKKDATDSLLLLLLLKAARLLQLLRGGLHELLARMALTVLGGGGVGGIYRTSVKAGHLRTSVYNGFVIDEEV